MSSKATALVLGLLATAASAPTALAATTDAIGDTVAVAQTVTAQLARDTRTLAKGDEIRQNEVLEASTDASGEFKLLDDTKLALGPGAKLTLDKFVYDPSKGGNSIVMRFAKGAFRFVTGLAEKNAYVIHVPSASITVRGTIFDVFVEDDGTSWLLLQEGGVRVCNSTGTCRDHSQPGKLIKISDDGALTKPTKWASLPGADKISFDSAFPFVVNPPSVDPKPVFTKEALLEPTSAPDKETTTPSNTDVPKKKRQKQASAEKYDTPAVKTAPKKTKATKLSQAQQKQQPKKEGYESDRDQGLDIAHEYAPKSIDKVRKDQGWQKGNGASPGGSPGSSAGASPGSSAGGSPGSSSGGESKGYQKYIDKYYGGR